MSGIERLKIISPNSGSGAWRFDVGHNAHSQINQIYIDSFDLADHSCEYIEVTKEEKLARYDIDFGIDVILTLKNGSTCTIQEKILTREFHTVTVEYHQDYKTDEPGNWFKLKCDFYFVGYIGHKNSSKLLRYILLDWNQVKRANINWQTDYNRVDNARASFKHAPFGDFPANSIIASQFNDYNKLEKRVKELKKQDYRGRELIELLSQEFDYPIGLNEVK